MAETVWFIRLFNRGVTIRSGDGELEGRGSRKTAKYSRLEKWKGLKTRRLFGFLIADLRLEFVLDEGRQRSGVILSDPVELS
jgi:hypothetical protein